MERKDLLALWENEFEPFVSWEEVKRMAGYAKATSVDEVREYVHNMINIYTCAVCFAEADGQPPIEREEPNPKNKYLPPCEVCGDPAQLRKEVT